MNLPDPSLDAWPTVIPLPAHAQAPALARQFIENHAGDLPPSLVADALIIVSELVTNAVLHGQPEIVLRVRLSPPGIGVGVQDGSRDIFQPAVVELDPTRPSGRGLQIVDALATSWGISPAPAGKIVWFELHEQPEQP